MLSLRFPYTYKTPDGVRHQDVFVASSKDEVFTELRKVGIRPIRVFDPIRPNRTKLYVSLISVFVMLVALGVVLFWVKTKRDADPRFRYRADTYVVFTNLTARADSLMRNKDKYFAKLDLDRSRDYAWISSNDVGRLLLELKKAKLNLGYTRAYVRDAFKDIYAVFPKECVNEISDSKKLYGRLMDELDSDEVRIVRDISAVKFLDAHREVWRVEEGRIIFSKENADRAFQQYKPEAGERISRWSRDFLSE